MLIKMIMLTTILTNVSLAGGDYISFLEDKRELRLLKDKLLNRSPASENLALNSMVLKMITRLEKERIKRNTKRKKGKLFIE